MRTKTFRKFKLIGFFLIASLALILLITMLSINTVNVAFATSESETESTELDKTNCIYHQNKSHDEQETQDVGIALLADKPKHPPSGSVWADDGTVVNRILIPNANYFITPPRHGENSTGSCGSVAVQLLLSYHNYYSDRRIIAPQYLHGGWNASGNGNIFDTVNYANPEQTPNASADPTNMTSWTLGSNQAYHDFIENNYVPGGGTIIGLENGMEDLLEDRNSAVAGTINFSTRHHHALGIFTIGTDGPIAEINAGRPVILGMYHTLGGIDHFVVAYGYQHLNGRFGYIVHYGWDENGTTSHTFRWIDADWVNSYAAMEVTHTHNYTVDEGADIRNNKRVVRCNTCGHRALDDLYNISGTTITGVRYPLTGSVTIPSAINGTAITAIGNSAFASQTTLSQVSIPSTVTAIGNSAFAHCIKLSQITIPSGVAQIGNSAFENCSSLKTVFTERPSTMGVPSLGSYAFFGTSLTDVFVPDSGDVGAYRTAPGWSGLSARFKTEYDIINPAEYYYIDSDTPYTEIERFYSGYYGASGYTSPEVSNTVLTFETSGIKTLYYAADGFFGYNLYDSDNRFIDTFGVDYPNDGSCSFNAVAGEQYTLRFWGDQNHITGYGILSVINSPEYVPTVYYAGIGFEHMIYGAPAPNVHLIFYDSVDEHGNDGYSHYRFTFTCSSDMYLRMHIYDVTNIMTYTNVATANNPAVIYSYIDDWNPVYIAIYIYTETPYTPVTLTVTRGF